MLIVNASILFCLKKISGISTTQLLTRLISDDTIPKSTSNGKTKTLCLKSKCECYQIFVNLKVKT